MFGCDPFSLTINLVQSGDDDQYCESNVDEQLLLNIGFREKVKVKVNQRPEKKIHLSLKP